MISQGARVLVLSFLGLFLGIWSASGKPPDEPRGPESTDFSRISAYASNFAALQRENVLLVDGRKQLMAERSDLQQRLLSSRTNLEQLHSASWVQSIRILENTLINRAATFDNHVLRNQSQPGVPQSQGRLALKGIQQRLVGSYFQNMALTEEMKQLDSAGRLVIERHRKLLMELESVVQQFEILFQNDDQLIQKYLDLADLAGTRSELELKAAMRELERADSNNVGAALALAITLMGMDRLDDAIELSDRVAALPQFKAIALALRGELSACLGDERSAKVDLSEAIKLGKDSPRVHWIRAQAFAAQGDLKAAEAAWQNVLRIGGHEIAARRGLALVYYSMQPQNSANVKKALEQARLAVGLSAEEDWSCQIALALALAATGEQENAVAAAEKAHELAVGNKRELCFSIVEQLKNAKHVVWQF